jgi:signal transduction histidine kinase
MTPAAPPEEVSRHKCLIYEGHPREQLPVIIPLLVNGLGEGRRCLYLGDPETVTLVGVALAERGVPVSELVRLGTLVLSSDRSHLENGGFDPAGMVAMLVRMIDQAVKDGYTGLCATGDMMWELGSEENFEKLQVYEALLETVFRDKPLVGICQYRRETVPARALRAALENHRSIYLGSTLREDNHFYLPPELHLETRDDGLLDRQGEWMCEQIRRVMNAEEKRDQALKALRESEAKQRRLAEDLARINADLDRRVRERTEELEAFTFSVSHDLRAPLRAVDGYSQVLLERHAASLGPEGLRHLEKVSQSCERMRQLIDDLLRLSRITLAPLNIEDVDLEALARGALDELLGGAARKNVDAVLGPLPRGRGDSSLLKQVFLNLIGNAVKYSARQDRSRIEIGGSSDGAEVTVWIRDNGVGFDMKHASRLFGVFERLHSPREFEGTGVGLALVQRIVRRHGGRVWAESVPGQGATFSFTLPRGEGARKVFTES